MDTCDATERAEARALRQSQGGQARHARTACLYRASARLLAANVEGTGFKNTSAASHAQPPKSPVRYNPAMAWQQARQEIRRKDGNLENAAKPPQQTKV